jgi:hypothetical protein
MPKLRSKNLKKLIETLGEASDINNASVLLLKKIKKDFKKQLVQEKLLLLQSIAQDFDLDYNDLKKYVEKSDKNKKVKEDDKVKDETEQLFDKIILEGESYFVDNKINGLMYQQVDGEAKVVGKVDNGNYIIDS